MGDGMRAGGVGRSLFAYVGRAARALIMWASWRVGSEIDVLWSFSVDVPSKFDV